MKLVIDNTETFHPELADLAEDTARTMCNGAYRMGRDTFSSLMEDLSDPEYIRLSTEEWARLAFVVQKRLARSRVKPYLV